MAVVFAGDINKIKKNDAAHKIRQQGINDIIKEETQETRDFYTVFPELYVTPEKEYDRRKYEKVIQQYIDSKEKIKEIERKKYLFLDSISDEIEQRLGVNIDSLLLSIAMNTYKQNPNDTSITNVNNLDSRTNDIIKYLYDEIQIPELITTINNSQIGDSDSQDKMNIITNYIKNSLYKYDKIHFFKRDKYDKYCILAGAYSQNGISQTITENNNTYNLKDYIKDNDLEFTSDDVQVIYDMVREAIFKYYNSYYDKVLIGNYNNKFIDIQFDEDMLCHLLGIDYKTIKSNRLYKTIYADLLDNQERNSITTIKNISNISTGIEDSLFYHTHENNIHYSIGDKTLTTEDTVVLAKLFTKVKPFLYLDTFETTKELYNMETGYEVSVRREKDRLAGNNDPEPNYSFIVTEDKNGLLSPNRRYNLVLLRDENDLNEHNSKGFIRSLTTISPSKLYDWKSHSTPTNNIKVYNKKEHLKSLNISQEVVSDAVEKEIYYPKSEEYKQFLKEHGLDIAGYILTYDSVLTDEKTPDIKTRK
ncbi:MAG: hypothetical protein IKP76_03695 [Bacilli bacterium]|nr:hypothetical protein [Bacilli bacterium]